MYGYLPDVALSLPVIQFFTLHREGRKAEAEKHTRLMIDLSSVATIAFGGPKQFEAVTDHFRSMGGVKERLQVEVPRGYDAASADAANAMRGLFGGINGR